MSTFEKFCIGDPNLNYNFNNTHFNQRLEENGLTREYVMQMVMEEEFEHYEEGDRKDSYKFYYPAPENKDFEMIKVILALKDDNVTAITVAAHFKDGNRKKRKHYGKTKQDKINDLRNKALKKAYRK